MTYGPTGGAKALTSGKPSRADIARLERRVQIIRNRFERWLRGQYRTMLRNLRDALADAMSQDGIDDALRGFDEDQRRACAGAIRRSTRWRRPSSWTTTPSRHGTKA